jgi:magnesium transporter
MIQYFKNIAHQTIAIDKAEDGAWVNVLPSIKTGRIYRIE